MLALFRELEQLTRDPFAKMKAKIDSELAGRFGIPVDAAPARVALTEVVTALEDHTGERAAEPAILYQWSARKLQPVVLVYVALIFTAMTAVAHFLLHSPTAVKAVR